VKGIVHFHSEYSYDSLSAIDKILDRSLSLNLEFLILTDHDTVDGSIHLRERIKERNPKEQNEFSEKLAIKFGISSYQGCDAHLVSEMKNVILVNADIENEEQLKNALLESNLNCLTKDYTDKRYIYLSQMIKGFKARNLRNIIKNLLKILVFTFK